MERKRRQPPVDRPPAEHKPPPAGNNLIWYLAGVAVVTLVLLSLFGTHSQVKIPYGELIRLIEKGDPTSTRRRPSNVAKGAGERNGGALLEAEEPPRRYLGNHRHRDQAGAARRRARSPRTTWRSAPTRWAA